MNLNFEYHDVSASERLEQLATEKLNKLESKYGFMVAADVYFKKENTSTVNTGMISGIRINIPGSTLFAESNAATFEASLAKATTEVRTQLQKKKEKMQTH